MAKTTKEVNNTFTFRKVIYSSFTKPTPQFSCPNCPK